ncbi:FTR1 family protein [Bradyrhizobium sp. LHD-71]|uniref:FTR1 family iron permease n=1 Tax=Bradyrhizobium sp. LHD-71 TaxID=3072141 RepID=UPI0028102FDF|nr:FTR1 family protein [Bradyrhizobium sp. LHD-71]MDQ8728696.1 FTR1 family protein [Bradyrhizobium sp. LHD-71]
MLASMTQAATILFREGLEAMLVIAALAGYLSKVGAGHRIKALYLGALAAIAASFVAAWIFAVFNSGQHDDTSEGIVIILASAIMLYVSGWLMLKQDPKSWKDFVAAKAEDALAKETAWAIGLLAFLSVFREGAETVLFITALANTEGGWTFGIFAGLLVGTALLAVLFVLLNRVARRIPLRPLFIITSAFLFLTALKFIGDAILEFQEQQFVTTTPLEHAGWLENIGLNATVEAVSIQFLVGLFVFAAFSLARREQMLSRHHLTAV